MWACENELDTECLKNVEKETHSSTNIEVFTFSRGRTPDSPELQRPAEPPVQPPRPIWLATPAARKRVDALYSRNFSIAALPTSFALAVTLAKALWILVLCSKP
eukprot:TRINITY_DN1314_c0_g1_i1.p1 TRINITY_DN1314_c0_g1~~TRINITY_DN1314_c0_g1_i1.p1  ORF type:complete len:104 (+),score=4.55 TRINITY_DN1314_c0_g1_i1:35-346(+)